MDDIQLEETGIDFGGDNTQGIDITGMILEVSAFEEDFQTISGLSPGDPELAWQLLCLSSTFRRNFYETRDVDDLENGLRFGLAGMAGLSKQSPHLPMGLSHISMLYGDKYDLTGEICDIKASVRYGMETVAITPMGHPSLPDHHYYLAKHYKNLFRMTRNLQDLQSALKCNLVSVAASPEEHPDLPILYQELAMSYSERGKETGNLHDLGIALEYGYIAITKTQEGDPELLGRQINVATFYHERYNRTGNSEDLDAALRHGLESVAMTPEEHPHLSSLHQNLAIYLKNRFKSLGDQHDLESALEHDLKAMALTPEGHPNLANRHYNIAMTYKDKYRTSGNLLDLETGLKHDLHAVNMTPEGNPDLASRQQNLAVSYNYRYRRTGDLQDLEAALKYGLAALNGTPEGHPTLPGQQSDLAVSYRDRYVRTGDTEDLEAALKYSVAAIDATPKGHPELPNRHKDLAIYYKDLFKKTNYLKDLKVALQYDLLAVNETPEGHPELSGRHHNLSVTHKSMYQITGGIQDLELALKHSLIAVTTSPNGHPDLTVKQVILAENYLDRLRSEAAVKDDLDQALKTYLLALQSVTTSPQHIWDATVLFVRNTDVFELPHILQACDIALKALPSVLWLGNSLGVRHDILVRHEVSELISIAVVTALKVSNIPLAVEYLEQGLGTTYQQMLQLKTEHDNLGVKLPLQSKRLQVLSAQLQGNFKLVNPNVNYHLLAHERIELISEIREHPGFEDFLLPHKYSNLSLAAKHGSVVLLNYAKGQTDAIIIISPSASPIHVFLSDITAAVVEKWMKQLGGALGEFHINSREIRHGRPSASRGISADRVLESVVSWIWEAIVKPIFDILNENGISDGRIWWCPSGPFTYFPLHAAAPIGSKFIQSYTPTLDTLIQANIRYITPHVHDSLTAVGVLEASPGQGTQVVLPFVGIELDYVASKFGMYSKELRNSQATIANVVKEMQQSPWLHIASHGVQDPQDPLQSGLILYDGKLELSTILNLDLPNAKFIYLSACETAMGDAKLMNEAMHLAGGFLAAGFQGAIGTLWSIPDAYGPKVAEIVYQTILGEDNIPHVKMAAVGLHLAVQKLRGEGAPLHQWMPFIHLGI
ncbi:CHAT domain-containing protein [Collybia nuda]|uniref:CHAT domain-containing protein n=1 Tax=Collybia nuda TaxID=64659 RepID=A0A9P5YEE1_9AGAR|nr:CHAT domain-containing protein [Collybia nuda]